MQCAYVHTTGRTQTGRSSQNNPHPLMLTVPSQKKLNRFFLTMVEISSLPIPCAVCSPTIIPTRCQNSATSKSEFCCKAIYLKVRHEGERECNKQGLHFRKLDKPGHEETPATAEMTLQRLSQCYSTEQWEEQEVQKALLSLTSTEIRMYEGM